MITNIIRSLGNGWRLWLFGLRESKRLQAAKNGESRSSAFERFTRVADEPRSHVPHGFKTTDGYYSEGARLSTQWAEQRRTDVLVAPFLGADDFQTDTEGDGPQVSVADSPPVQTKHITAKKGPRR